MSRRTMRRQSLHEAGIHRIPALSLSLLLVLFLACPLCGEPYSTTTLQRLLNSPFVDGRSYAELPDENERMRLLSQDLEFEAYVAGQAKAQGCAPGPGEKQFLESQRDMLLSAALKATVAGVTSPTAEQVKRLADEHKWTERVPAKYEVCYLFVDASQAQTSQTRQQLHGRALKIHDELTTQNFCRMARLWSDAPSSAQGGAIEAFALESRGPVFAAHVKQTPPGTIGGPYETPSGWNILYVRKVLEPEEHALSFEQQRQMAVQVLADEQLRRIRGCRQSWESMLRKTAPEKDPAFVQQLQAYENRLLAARYLAQIAAATSPTQEQLRELFAERGSSLAHNPRRKAREILLTSEEWTTASGKQAWLARRAVRDRAREMRERILGGEDFGRLARRHSAAPSAASGGDIGWVEEPSSYLLDSALAELKPGELSAPVATDRGYLLLQLLEVEERKPMSFEEALPHLENIWLSLRRKQAEQELKARFARREDAP